MENLVILETNPKIWFLRNGVYLASRIFRIEFVQIAVSFIALLHNTLLVTAVYSRQVF